MKGHERDKLEKKGRGLYASGVSKDRVAKELQISDRTVDRWCKKYKWDNFRDKVDEKSGEKLLETVAEMKVKHIKIVQHAIARFLENIRSKDINISGSEIAKLLQHEHDLRIPRTISQFNFMQQKNLNVDVNLDSAALAKQLFEKYYGTQGNISKGMERSKH